MSKFDWSGLVKAVLPSVLAITPATVGFIMD